MAGTKTGPRRLKHFSLAEEDKMVSLFRDGIKRKYIAERFGVCQGVVDHIINSWCMRNGLPRKEVRING